MKTKGYLYAKVYKDGNNLFGSFRSFVENMFLNVGQEINRYALRYLDANQNDKTATYLYKGIRKEKFDDLKIDDCSYSSFFALGASPNIHDNPISLYFKHSANNMFSIQITWQIDDCSERKFVDQADLYRQLIQNFFGVAYIFAGCMSNEKAVDFFVLGMLHETLSDLEKKVARNIQRATYLDIRIPYLFPYNYLPDLTDENSFFDEMKHTILFPSLITSPLDSYHCNSNWESCYAILKSKNLLIPIE